MNPAPITGEEGWDRVGFKFVLDFTAGAIVITEVWLTGGIVATAVSEPMILEGPAIVLGPAP
jgi:hypothetical protein